MPTKKRTLGNHKKLCNYHYHYFIAITICFLLVMNQFMTQLEVILEDNTLAAPPMAIVYIAGRNPNGKGDTKTLMDEVHLSILSACKTSTTAPSDALSFLIFVSEHDYNVCSNQQVECDYLAIEKSCHSVLPTTSRAYFEYLPLNQHILDLWANNTDISSFSHHSTWYGYAKVWLPVILERHKVSAILFVDTDTLWNKHPNIIFNELRNFNESQMFGATSIVDRPKHNISLSFPNRITSGVLLMDMVKLSKLNWKSLVGKSIAAGRGVDVRAPIPSGYNISEHCEDHFWGDFILPYCLVKPISGCKHPSSCWEASAGDQEFFSYIVSFVRPDILYELPKVHQHIQMGKIIDTSNYTLLHAPGISQLWNPAVSNGEISNNLPELASQSVHYFRKNVKNITV